MPVRFSTRCPNSDYLGFEASPEAIVAAAKKAEEVGFDAIFVNDHIIVDGSPRAAPWTNVYRRPARSYFGRVISVHMLCSMDCLTQSRWHNQLKSLNSFPVSL